MSVARLGLAAAASHLVWWTERGLGVADQVLAAAGDLAFQVGNVGRPDKTSDEWRRLGHAASQDLKRPETGYTLLPGPGRVRQRI